MILVEGDQDASGQTHDLSEGVGKDFGNTDWVCWGNVPGNHNNQGMAMFVEIVFEE